MGIPTATRVDANFGIDSEIGVNAESRRRNSKWTKNSASGEFVPQIQNKDTFLMAQRLSYLFVSKNC